MTPHLKGKSDNKISYRYYFAINHTKITNKQMQQELSKYGFRQETKEIDKQSFDFTMTIRLEEHYNPSKFANDLIKKYQDELMEVRMTKL